MTNETPKQLGYYFPAEWQPHEATWLTWPYLDDSFPGLLNEVYPSYTLFVKYIADVEKVRIIVPSQQVKNNATGLLNAIGAKISSIEFYIHPTNDVWCRDHGPAFVINRSGKLPKAIVDWEFNAWGGKYSYQLDNQIPAFVAKQFGFRVFRPGIVMEG
ncbi:MAG: agmatine deiminase family protein, partial [Bacteroidales bacterium]|nr:agmatine deiminase family protein [Bacteroidales bacterium]